LLALFKSGRTNFLLAPPILVIHSPSDRDTARMNELSELAREGALCGEDQAELDSYIHVTNLLAVMQAKGRRALR
jgi:hypothetical protein